MNIKILQLIEGAREAAGLTVIIDVFRAFTVACYVIGNGAERIIPVGDVDLAYRLKRENPGCILIGERKGKILPGFDYGNSPAHLENVDLRGKTIIQTTSAGTQGIVNAVGAEEIITASFVNVQAVIDYIKIKAPEELSLVCMGFEGQRPSDEDTFCAQYIRNSLEQNPLDFADMVEKLRNGSGKRFFEPASQDWAPARDFDLCVKINRFNFVLQAKGGDEGLIYLQRI